MLRLATVFSGIGAIEHALDRMEIEHEIVFACDNGDVEILTKDVGMDVDTIGNELMDLSKLIADIQFNDEFQDLYKQQLENMLDEALKENTQVLKRLKKIKACKNSVKELLETIFKMKNVKTARVKEYKKFYSEMSVGSAEQQVLKEFQIILEIVNDFKKDNSLDDLGEKKKFDSTDGISWNLISRDLRELYDYLEENNGKKIIRKVQDLSQRTSQLHEKINYMNVQKKLESLGDDWTARKKYVDSLYKGLESRNKVKKSYMANYEISDEDFHWNVAFLDGHQYENQVDLFVGGSPCQSFSLVGKQRGLEDTRGTLFFEYARLIDEIHPKVFIYENVRAVTSHDGGKTWEK
ncbi:MAG: DNA cytosine methyltransferase, partial [Eubacterium sp.]|nr:DNA cytosine methyltransferase [Eubacterium sp.]